MLKQKQKSFFKKTTNRYGGDLLTKRKARQGSRPISTQHSMHFVLKSSQATGDWSFFRHKKKIQNILEEFAVRYGIKLLSFANVGNHLHLHLQFTSRHTYTPFIRAISSAIMMAVTGISRWNKIELTKKFWDRRPYSRFIIGFKALLNIQDYIKINKYEGWGFRRDSARFLVAWDRAGKNNSS